MQLVGKLELNLVDEALDKRKLSIGGTGQKFVDSECIRLMKPYTPNLNGVLIDSATRNTVIGSGKIVQNTPYARYHYYGVLYVDPITKKGAFFDAKTGRFWSRSNTPKIPSDRTMKYNTTKSPLAGSHWFERMKKDNSDDIGKGLAKLCGGEFKR